MYSYSNMHALPPLRHRATEITTPSGLALAFAITSSRLGGQPRCAASAPSSCRRCMRDARCTWPRYRTSTLVAPSRDSDATGECINTFVYIPITD